MWVIHCVDKWSIRTCWSGRGRSPNKIFDKQLMSSEGEGTVVHPALQVSLGVQDAAFFVCFHRGQRVYAFRMRYKCEELKLLELFSIKSDTERNIKLIFCLFLWKKNITIFLKFLTLQRCRNPLLKLVLDKRLAKFRKYYNSTWRVNNQIIIWCLSKQPPWKFLLCLKKIKDSYTLNPWRR